MNIASILATKSGQVITIRADQSIREAIALLSQHDIGVLVVVDPGNRPVGIVSERDVVRQAARDEQLYPRAVAEIMTADVVTGLPTDDLGTVANTMTERRIRHLPVMEHGKLVGMVSIGDVVKAQRDAYQGQAETLEIQILTEDDRPTKTTRR